MSAVRKILNCILKIFVIGSFTLMVILVCLQALLRYSVNVPFAWIEEFVSYAIGWVGLMGVALVFEKREHYNIPVVVRRFGPKGQKILALLSEIVVFIFSVTVLIYGGGRTCISIITRLGMPLGYFYSILPISGVCIGIYAWMNFVEILSGKIVILAKEKH